MAYTLLFLSRKVPYACRAEKAPISSYGKPLP